MFIFYFIFYFFLFYFFLYFFYNFFFKNNKYYFLKNFFLEFIWIFLFFYFISFLFFYSIIIILKFKKNFTTYVSIKLISYQWKWYFIYLNNFISYFSIFDSCVFKILNYNNFFYYNFFNVNNKLILPINKTIRFIFFSNDVIHSLYVPSIGMKQDSIPGFLKDFYFKSNRFGNYFGFCTELCGKNHSYIPLILKVVSFYSYNKWIISFFLKKNIILNY